MFSKKSDDASASKFESPYLASIFLNFLFIKEPKQIEGACETAKSASINTCIKLVQTPHIFFSGWPWAIDVVEKEI